MGDLSSAREETLDPEDWEALKKLGHQMVDDMLDHLRGLDGKPAWQPLPEASRRAIHDRLPEGETDFRDVYGEFVRHVLPYPNGNLHPRFWGWVQGTGTPYAMLADMLASGMNAHLAGFEQSAVEVEKAVLDWLKALLGFPAQATGLLTSGGTMANLTALAVARHAAAGTGLRERGLQDPACPRLVAYASTETHSWARKAMELMGHGHRALRLVPVDGAYRIRLPALREQLAADRAEGLRPFCVIGNAGTVNTGAVDDLGALADLAREEDLWFHIDGAFGALAALSPAHAAAVKGQERADSIAFDLHKWAYVPFEAGCVLVRRPEVQREAFALTPHYLAAAGRGVSAGPLIFADLGIELTRSFKALKVWMSFKAHGTRKLGRIIGQNIEQARYLATMIERSPRLRLLAPVSLNVVCFRYEPAGSCSDARLDELNSELLLRLQESGLAVLSGTRLEGRFGLRAAIVNHRSRRADFERLVDALERLGADLVTPSRAAPAP